MGRRFGLTRQGSNHAVCTGSRQGLVRSGASLLSLARVSSTALTRPSAWAWVVRAPVSMSLATKWPKSEVLYVDCLWLTPYDVLSNHLDVIVMFSNVSSNSE